MTDTSRPSAGLIASYVRELITPLQKAYLAESSSARGELAQLRALSSPDDAGVTALAMIPDLPTPLRGTRDDRLSPAEKAIITALHLYAIHQQSNHEPAHMNPPAYGEDTDQPRLPGRSLATAIRMISDTSDKTWTKRGPAQRLIAAMTATDDEERLIHIRSCVRLVHSSGNVALDYGRLAADMWGLSNPSRANSIRLAWSRDLVSPLRDESSFEDKQPEPSDA